MSFYDQDIDLVGEVVPFLLAGLAAGERLVVVATAGHRAAIDEALLVHGHDAGDLRSIGRYVALDAREALAGFMVGGAPDAGRFLGRFAPIVGPTAGSTTVRVFGEMVALLWEDGNVAAAVQLETLWNELAADSRFTLLCAYPASVVQSGTLTTTTEVCQLHSRVHPPHSYVTASSPASGPRGCSEVYLPVPAAVPATRRFVAQVLTSWGLEHLVDDAELIASELATNAVNHAVSAFRVRLQHTATQVRVAIEDIGPSRPVPGRLAPDSTGGRGVVLVETTASSWGCDAHAHGKEVWATLERRVG